MDEIGGGTHIRSTPCYTIAFCGSLAIAALMILGCAIGLVGPTTIYSTKEILRNSLPTDLVNLLGMPLLLVSIWFPFLFSGRRHVRHDGLSHPFGTARHPGSCCMAPGLLHLDLAARFRTTVGLGRRGRQLVLDAAGTSDRVYGVDSLGLSKAGESKHSRRTFRANRG